MSFLFHLFFLGLLHDLARYLSIQLEHGPQQHRLVERQLDDVEHDQDRDNKTSDKPSHVRIDACCDGYELCDVDRCVDRVD